jgi:hypothetical protein
MIVDGPTAATFIRNYKALLLHIAERAQSKPGVLDRMHIGRRTLLERPVLLESAQLTLKGTPNALDEDFVEALTTLQVKRWVYLRDTRSHSIFIEPSGAAAYAVLGLTNKIKDIIGGVGAYIETGLVRFRGHYLCDGLVAQVVWLGPNYKRDFNAVFRKLRAGGQVLSAAQQGAPVGRASLREARR